MTEISSAQKFKKFLKKEGYEIITDSPPKEFTWSPDFYTKKGDTFFAYLMRESNVIPEVLVQRIASMKPIKNKLRIYIIFCKKPTLTALKTVSLYGIGTIFFHKNILKILKESKDFSKSKKPIEKKKIIKKEKMPRNDIFISSHQDVDERKIVKDLINDIRSTFWFSIYPILVEEDTRYNIQQTRECIIRNMDDSELFIGILAEEFRKDVDYEIKRAFNICYDCSDIFIFIKTIKERPVKLNQLITWIKGQNNVKYIEYTDKNDLKKKVYRTLFYKLKEIHDNLGIPFLE